MYEPIFTRQTCIRLAATFALVGTVALTLPISQPDSISNYPTIKPVAAFTIGLLAINSNSDELFSRK